MTLNAVQFDQERLDRALAIPQEQRRLQAYTARKQAARSDAAHWALAVHHSSHDDLHRGITTRQVTHVLLSKEEYPEASDAEQTAYLIGQARGTYPTRVSHV